MARKKHRNKSKIHVVRIKKIKRCKVCDSELAKTGYDSHYPQLYCPCCIKDKPLHVDLKNLLDEITRFEKENNKKENSFFPFF